MKIGKIEITEEKRGGFEDDPLYVRPCNSMSHNAPNFIHIPQGKIYRHICPSCGAEQILRPPMTMMWSTECATNNRSEGGFE